MGSRKGPARFVPYVWEQQRPLCGHCGYANRKVAVFWDRARSRPLCAWCAALAWYELALAGGIETLREAVRELWTQLEEERDALADKTLSDIDGGPPPVAHA